MPEQVIFSQVECQSGYSHCDHPTAIIWEGKRLAVKNIEAEWREPDIKYYRILTEDCIRLEIQFNENENIWRITPITMQNLCKKNSSFPSKEN